MTKTSVEQQDRSQFLTARMDFTERWGGLAMRERAARRLSYALIVITSLSLLGNVMQIQRGGPKPFVVVVDGASGRTLAWGSGAGDVPPGDAGIRLLFMRRFVEDARTVTMDGALQRRMNLRVHHFVESGSQANQKLTEYFRDNNPLTRAEKELVEVQVRSVVPLAGGHSYEVEWAETTRETSGRLKKTETWKAVFSLTSGSKPPIDDVEALRDNPLGMFVTQIWWDRIEGGAR